MRITMKLIFKRAPTTALTAAFLLDIASVVAMPGPGGSAADAGPAEEVYLRNYAAALSGYVDRSGMVDYQGLKAGRKPLDDFIAALGELEPGRYEKFSEKQKVAFWINAYNARTLQVILDNYPIESSFFASLRFPKNSIRQIKGVWDALEFPVMGRKMTLDEIEHQTLRKLFNEPRIHMALVCAAMGCPLLRNEPYTGERLDCQLDSQTRNFLADPEKFRADRRAGRVYLSPIFKWFAGDFVKNYLEAGPVKGFDEEERAVLNFISGHLDYKDGLYVHSGEFKVSYLDYDWALNEQEEK